MYVCLCHNVTDGQIRREVRLGAVSMRELRERLGVATGCGRCAPCARQVLKQAVRELRGEDAAPGWSVVPEPALG